MKIIISPAKNLDFKKPVNFKTHTQPAYLQKSEKLVKELRKLNSGDLQTLMKINPKLGDLNVERFLQWHTPFNETNSRQAILVFNGEVYNGIQAHTLSEDDLNYSQDTLIILSGLYGLLKPLDLIQAYRLEMGTKLSVDEHQNLYSFWGDSLHKQLKKELSASNNVLINLASNEYSKAVKPEKLNSRIITPSFLESRGDDYKKITVYFKKARGLMVRFIIQNKIKNPEDLKHFDLEGYFYNDNLSKGDNWIYTR